MPEVIIANKKQMKIMKKYQKKIHDLGKKQDELEKEAHKELLEAGLVTYANNTSDILFDFLFNGISYNIVEKE